MPGRGHGWRGASSGCGTTGRSSPPADIHQAASSGDRAQQFFNLLSAISDLLTTGGPRRTPTTRPRAPTTISTTWARREADEHHAGGPCAADPDRRMEGDRPSVSRLDQLRRLLRRDPAGRAVRTGRTAASTPSSCSGAIMAGSWARSWHGGSSRCGSERFRVPPIISGPGISRSTRRDAGEPDRPLPDGDRSRAEPDPERTAGKVAEEVSSGPGEHPYPFDFHLARGRQLSESGPRLLDPKLYSPIHQVSVRREGALRPPGRSVRVQQPPVRRRRRRRTGRSRRRWTRWCRSRPMRRGAAAAGGAAKRPARIRASSSPIRTD